MKKSFKIILILLLCSCSTKNILNKDKIPTINFNINEDKYSLILKNTFFKSYQKIKKNEKTITVSSRLSFKVTDTLSIRGKSNLKRLKGRLIYEIKEDLNSKILYSGNISSSINYGSITSLYGIDTSLEFAKERLSRYLANKLYSIVILRVRQIDN